MAQQFNESQEEDECFDEEVEAPEFSDEELRDSAYSEVDEEMGHRPEHEEEQGSHSTVKNNFKYTTFLAVVNPQQKMGINNKINLNWESDAYSWFDIDQLPQNIHQGVISAIQSLIVKRVMV
jgi:ADP-ribose pyrophosphatase YjhB (NUDIX family)